MSTILSLAPQNVWKHFYSLTQIPRPSGHMEKVTEFLINFGKGLGLESFVDEAGNVIIRKPATPGMENRKGVILQAHMDMVPQKNNDTVHDFEKDPIETYIDGDWVKAKGTTLGADNGLGVAAIMAVLEAKDLKHGPLEALITKDEETGMYGAFGLKPGTLNGEILLNLDSEDEGELYIGCAGGMDVTATLEYKEVVPEAGDIAVKVTLKGLRGDIRDWKSMRGVPMPISYWFVSFVKRLPAMKPVWLAGKVVICVMLSRVRRMRLLPFRLKMKKNCWAW